MYNRSVNKRILLRKMDKEIKKFTNEEWKEWLNSIEGYTGVNFRPLDQFEEVILRAINEGKSFETNTKYDVINVGKGFKNAAVEIIKDSQRSKIFISAFHVNKGDESDKLVNITLYKYIYEKNEKFNKCTWKFDCKIIIENSSGFDFPVEKLNKYVIRQLELQGKKITGKYSKVVEGDSAKELETYTNLIEAVRNIDDFDQTVAILRQIFEDNEKADLMKYLLDNELLPEDIEMTINQKSRIDAVKSYINMLNNNCSEFDWQKWFSENSWLLGTEFVRIIDERRIDVENITDYLVEAYDGFLDVVEIKKPSSDLKFWSDTKDHNNYFPHSDLIKAITQSLNYISQVEKKIDSKDFQERVDNVSVIKPRCTLIFGRSLGWNDEQKEAYRILNSSYHNITILTYDHVLERAKRVVGSDIKWPNLDELEEGFPF